MRVSTLATELGVDPKDIRKFLREQYGQVGTGSRWDLNQAQIERVKWRFEGRSGQAIRERGGPSIPLPVRRYSGPGIVDKVNQLRLKPDAVHIKVEGSDEVLTFHKIVQSWSSRGTKRSGSNSKRIVLLSNGEFKESGSFKGIYEWLLEPNYCPITRGGTYYLHHKNYVQALSEIKIPSWLVTQLIERPTTGLSDNPQELLISEYSQYLDSRLTSPSILKWEHSTDKPIGEISLKELWGSSSETEISRGNHLSSSSDLRLAFSRYFATINLLQEHPLHGEAFEITLGEVFRRFHVDVGRRAENLRKDMAEKYGFEAHGDEWRKKRGSDSVAIHSDLIVHINGKFVCIVSARTSQLPLDDEIARRMLTVATAHRDQISTIKGELKASLERLFPVGKSGEGL